MPQEMTSAKFKSLMNFQKGGMRGHNRPYDQMRPKPNLRPPGHSEAHLIDYHKYLKKHPVFRFWQNAHRQAELDYWKANGKTTPKKGAGGKKGKK